MMGVFVQVNESSPKGRAHSIGYVIQENGCWDWVGNRLPSGYGQAWHDGRVQTAHRVMYQKERGPIEPGWDVDHLCRNRGCVNPNHLEAVPHRTNVIRGTGWAGRNAAKSHCPQGHLLAGDNLRANRGYRECAVCQHQSNLRRPRRPFRVTKVEEGQ